MITAGKDGFYISSRQEDMDLDFVYGYLTESYWAKGIPKETVKKSIEHSLCFGVFSPEGQVGFARMITDRATYAYLADVFIDEKFRGKGLARWLMEIIMAHPELQGLRQILLATRDAHGLYAKVGFQPLSNTERWMRIANQDVYTKNTATPVQP